MSVKRLIVPAVLLAAFAGVFLVKAENDELAERNATSATDEPTRRFWDVYREATGHRTARRFEEAASAYQELLRMNPKHEDGLYYLGNMYVELGEYVPADSAWRMLEKLNPSSSRALIRRGDLRLCFPESELLNFSEAAESYRRAFTVNKEHTGPQLRMGLAALAAGRGTDAARFFSDVLSADHTSSGARIFAAYLEWMRGDVSQAESHYTATVETPRTDEGERVVGEGDRMVGEGERVVGEGDTKGATVHLRESSTDCPFFDRFGAAPADSSPSAMERRFDEFTRELHLLQRREQLRRSR